jgi:hypothetical protein
MLSPQPTISAVANRPTPVARQKVETFADCWQDVDLRFVPLQTDEAGYGGEVCNMSLSML